ncbi:anoctamin-10-like [Acipenser oxyrinchus oxyrinchus]|uniref:Anoctamin n=1 Tax=Acipenser oxyrinchus oxyrinchus TaxID=40147 RepID=A0AAD8D701_ACIOX|nr:anoctamin-10-like [Acipenser oxyrinchus oxyrinchus]
MLFQRVSKGVVTIASGSWTKVTCKCCFTDAVRPLLVIELNKDVQLETKEWIISKIEAPANKQGAQLLAHPGEDDDGDMILVAAPSCTLLRNAEALGLSKAYRDGTMLAFSYPDRANFKNADNVEELLTLAEQQYISKKELDDLKAGTNESIPGCSKDKGSLYPGELIFQKLEKSGIVKTMYPLHDKEKLSAFSKQWYSQFNFGVQPLDYIHSYFGGTVAFYFSFLGFYTLSLLLPAVLGAVLYFLPWNSLNGQVLLAIFNVVWSTVVLELWKRRSAELAYGWGTLLLNSTFEEPRPNYRGTMGHNPVTRRWEPYFPSAERKKRIWFVSTPVVCAFLWLTVMGMVAYFYLEWCAKDYYSREPSWLAMPLLYLPSVLHILYVDFMNHVYKTVAHMLTEWENHRVESDFQKHYTLKVLVFSFINCFAVLFYIAFYKQDLELLRKRLASLLIVSQIINQVTEALVPYLQERFLPSQGTKQREADPHIDKLRAQGCQPEYPGLFAEYIELFVQFGYLSLFSCVYPLTAALLFLNNVTEIRTDALKICKLFRKPFVAPAANIGIWQTAFEALGFVSVISNCWLILISPQVTGYCQENGVSFRYALLCTIALEHVLIILKVVIAFVIPDLPKWVRIKVAQLEFRSRQALKTVA